MAKSSISGMRITKMTVEDVEELGKRNNLTEEEIVKLKNVMVPVLWVKNNLFLPKTTVPRTVPLDVTKGSPLYKQFQYDYLADKERFIACRVSRQTGKCVVGSTKVVVRSGKSGKAFTSSIFKLYIMFMLRRFKRFIIDKFFVNLFPDKFVSWVHTDGYEVLTDSGYQPFTKIVKTVKYDIWKVVDSYGHVLYAADDHIVFDGEFNEIYVKNLFPGNTIQTKEGLGVVLFVERIASRKHMYDLEVRSDDHRYYTNGILSHNTTIILAEMLYFFYNYPGISIIIAAPYVSQVKNLFTMMYDEMIPASFTSDLIKKDDPFFLLESKSLKSKIMGFPIRSKNKSGSSPIRSYTAQILFIDEADFLMPSEVAAAEGTLNSYGDYKMIRAASTLSKLEGSWFYNVCKSGEYSQYFVPYPKTENYTPEEERRILLTSTYDNYVREYLVDWNLLESGLFKAKDLNKAIDKAENLIGRTYSLKDPEIVKHAVGFIVGVDWNGANNGVQIVVTFYDKAKSFFVYDVISITDSEFTQTLAVRAIIDTVKQYRPIALYVDRGFGDMQIEQLIIYDRNHPEDNLNFSSILRPINAREKIEVTDPLTGKVIKKQAKAFSVSILQYILEKNDMYLPDDQWKSRDNKENSKASKRNSFSNGIVDEMTAYYVKNYDSYGDPIYATNGTDHKLSALQFAGLAYALIVQSDIFVGGNVDRIIEQYGNANYSYSGSNLYGSINNSIDTVIDNRIEDMRKYDESAEYISGDVFDEVYTKINKSRNFLGRSNRSIFGGRRSRRLM